MNEEVSKDEERERKRRKGEEEGGIEILYYRLVSTCLQKAVCRDVILVCMQALLEGYTIWLK